MSKVWKVAVIGAGDMGGQHVKGWQMAEHEVVSVTDLDTQRANELASRYNIKRVFNDYKEAINDADVEIVSVCLPLALHAAITIYAAGHGKHVFCEKPLARNFQEADAMEEAMTKAGVQFGIGFQRNLTKGVIAAKELIQDGKLGRPVFFHCESVAEIRPKRIMHDANGNMGPLMDLGCHYYVMWQTVFGSQPKTVYAQGRVLAKDRQELSHIENLAVDTAVVTVEYQSGDVGVFNVTWGMPPNFKLRAFQDRIYGPKGGAEGGFNHNANRISLCLQDQIEEIPLEVYPSLHKEQFELFVNALNQGKPAPVSFQTGRDILAVTLAIFRSIVTGEVVDFPAFYKEITRREL